MILLPIYIMAKSVNKRSSRRLTDRSGRVQVPERAQKAALLAFDLKKKGFKGATETGWKRAAKLARGALLSRDDLRTMRAWFARHRFASLPSYEEWEEAGKPLTNEWKGKRGIIAVLCWGGPTAMRWLSGPKVSRLLQ
jgi:hypothetical protein